MSAPLPRAQENPEQRAARERVAASRKRRRTRDFAVLLVVLVLVGIILYQSPARVFDVITSPMAVLIFCIMVVEYLVIKSSDRTRIYRLENQRLRERRREAEEMLREADALLRDGTVQAPDAWHAEATNMSKRIEKML